MDLLYDVETNGLLNKLDRIHCLAIKDVSAPIGERKRWTFRRHEGYNAILREDTGEEVGMLASMKLLAGNPDIKFRNEARPPQDNIAEGVDMLRQANSLIGHNLIGFDQKAVKIVFPDFDFPREKVVDTLPIARMVRPNIGKDIDPALVKRGKLPGKLVGSHSLDAWGHRLGFHKGDYSVEMLKAGLDPWASWNLDMEVYCDNDIDVNEVLWEALKAELVPESAQRLELAAHEIATKISEGGFPFDKAAAEALRSDLETRLAALEDRVKKIFGFWYAPKKKRIVKEPWPDASEERNTLESQIDMLESQRERYVAQYDKLFTDFEKGLPGAEERLNDKEEYLVRKIKDCDRRLPALREALKGFSKVNARPNKEWGEDYSRAVWADVVVSKKTMRSVRFGDRTEGSAYCPIQKVEFNPGSRPQIVDRLSTIHGWEPTDFTDKGNPTVDHAVLKKLVGIVPMADEMADIFFYKKLVGQLATGNGSWLNSVEDDGMIHHYINTGGTVSGRCAHNSPNLGQVPSVVEEKINDKTGGYAAEVCDPVSGRPYPEVLVAEERGQKKVLLLDKQGEFGVECRRLFYVPQYGYYTDDGRDVLWRQVGVDLSGIEFRCLAELTAPFDDGELIDVIVSGQDVHDFNMKKTGITNRSLIKRVLYGLMYGAGDWKLGHTIDPHLTDDEKRAKGKEIRKTLMDGLPALKQAIDKVREEAEAGFLIGLDGRKLFSRSPHSALNLRLQSDAAMIAKKWLIYTHDDALAAGMEWGWMGDFTMLAFVHDEIQAATRADMADKYAAICTNAAKKAGQFFNFKCPIEAQSKIGQDWAECH